MRLVDEENQVVDIGEEGEIQVKTYSRLKEYRVQEEKMHELFTDDGFLRTGNTDSSSIGEREECMKWYPLFLVCRDMGVMFADGSVTVKGRTADAMRFKVFTEVIYPGPIAMKLSWHVNIEQISVTIYHLS